MRLLHRLLAATLALLLPAASLAAVPEAPPSPPPAGGLAAPEYDEALEALRAGRWGEGNRLLDRYLERGAVPNRAEAELLRDLSRRMAVSVEAGLPPGTLDQRGRAELAVFSTLYGLWAGGLVTYLGGGFDDGDELLLVSSLFGGMGLAGSLAATSGREITEGRARLVSMGGTWGSVNAVAWGLQAGFTEKPLVATVLASGLAGIAAGATLFDEAPDPGYLSLVNTAGLWSAYAAGLLLVLAESEASAEDDFAMIVAGADLGLIATALAARDVEISQGRVRLIDLGGLLGTLTTGGILVANEPDSPQTVAVTLLAGTTAGIVLATLATASWDDPPGGELRSDLEWRGPGLALLPGTDGKSVALGANVVSGSF